MNCILRFTDVSAGSDEEFHFRHRMIECAVIVVTDTLDDSAVVLL